MLASHLTMRAHSQRVFNLTNWVDEDLEDTIATLERWLVKEFTGVDGPISRVVKQLVLEHQLRAEARVQAPIERKRQADAKITEIMGTTSVKKAKEV